jgi:hypothetical protein
MKIIKDYLFETEVPIEYKQKFWYHGTFHSNAIKIIKSCKLKPIENPDNGYMSPIAGKVYLTSRLDEGLIYAFYRACNQEENPKYAYLVIVKGEDLVDILPDEDIIANLLPKLYYSNDNLSKNEINKFIYKNSDLTKDEINKFIYLNKLAKETDSKLYHKYHIKGNYEYGTALGKKIIKLINDDQKIDLINYGQKIANDGCIPIYQVWEIPVDKRNEINKNIDSFQFYSKLLYSSY